MSRNFQGLAKRRWLVLVLGLVALAFQSFVVQTHIHAPKNFAQLVQLDRPDAPPHLRDVNTKPAPDRFPINDDPSNCPLCQVVTLTGHYVTAAVILIITPADAGNAFAIDAALPTISRTHSHSWLGRAPPLA